MKLKKGDIVLVTKGKYRIKKGKVVQVFPEKNRIVVEGINIIKKHVKAKKTGEKGQIVEIPASIHVSNTKLICKNCAKVTRIEYKTTGKKKYRICKKCKKET